MTHRKRRRIENEKEELDTGVLETTGILSIEGRRRYSECSLSAQSRRRAHLVREICVQAGVEEPPTDTTETKECAKLLQDTLSKSSGMTAVEHEIKADGRLDRITSNILALHEGVNAEQRTRILALVANEFTGVELKQLGFSFGTHQLKEARQLAEQKEFVQRPKQRFVPESKRPKSEEFTSRLQSFLDKRSVPADNTDVDCRRIVCDNTVRGLHREFMAENANNKVSFSTFRALAMEKYRLPHRSTAAAVATAESSSCNELTDKHREDDEIDNIFQSYRPLQPRPAETTATSDNLRLTTEVATTNAFAGFPLLETESTGLLLNTQSTGDPQMVSLDIPGFAGDTQLPLPLLLPSLGQTSQGIFQTGFSGLDIPATAGAAAALFGNIGGGTNGGHMQEMEGTGYIPAIHSLFSMAPALSINPRQTPHQQNITSEAADSNTLPATESSADSLPSTFFYF
ncbi:hypothetical protein COEREDRAFT_10182 [Coemansia reversa NRRL 1564]|uniref:Uncharacterized protein n=1 Tax=Coemansia reversa (strain ATCC 12441 / NRRL 1564) TaxID=763665 RepID=A0A2G5B6C4_COERN|nr:hypothetical protein COEREDRAFT_10182 [Coemansia reversa NRRL 1564]|eukprot:PIA14576.1 hypothetical protein COEREDRAFT_10182 [Coemansia reversa NRRL 1564]